MAVKGTAASFWAVETAPPSLITVHKRSSSASQKLDTIVEESTIGHLESEMTNSFSSLGLSWNNGKQSLSSYQRHGSTYTICAQ